MTNMGRNKFFIIILIFLISNIFCFTGNINMDINPNMNDPIEITITGQQDEMQVGESITVTATVPSDTGDVVYEWFINSETRANGDSFTIGMGLDAGIYRLDVSVFTVDGRRAGSVSHDFEVAE